MSLLQEVLERGEFAITAEVAPPKGTDLSHLLECAKKFGIGDCTRCPLYSAKYLPCEIICNNTCKALRKI